MTEYKFTSTTEPPISSRSEVKERKEKRKKQLAAVFQRRREIYKRYLKKLRLREANRKTIVFKAKSAYNKRYYKLEL